MCFPESGSKSIADYSEYWRQLSDEIERTPMEDQLKRKVRIVCNDCLERSTTDFHFLGALNYKDHVSNNHTRCTAICTRRARSKRLFSTLESLLLCDCLQA